MLLFTGCTNKKSEEILASVGDYKITRGMVEKEMAPVIDIQKQIYTEMTKDELENYKTDYSKNLTQYLAEVEVLYLEATKENYSVDKTLLEESYSSIEESIDYYFEMTMEEFSKKYKFELDYIKDSIEKQTIASNYLFDSVKIDEKILENYYNENLESFKLIQASHILISNENELLPEDASVGDNGTHTHDDGTVHEKITDSENDELTKLKEDNKNKANDILKRALSGEDFKSLSDQYSQDEGAKENGGDLGFFAKGSMVEKFENAAFDETLKNNQVYDKLVETEYGYHIIKKIDEKYYPFEDAKEYIESEVFLNDALEKFISQLTDRYEIDYNLE